MVLSDLQLREIADGLESGMRCYYNRVTGDIKTIINLDSWIGADSEFWEDDNNEIEENFADYFEFVSMTSHESFQIMADFVNVIADSKFKSSLVNALNRPKPFSNFKRLIDDTDDIRQHWFEFKQARYIEWVKDQMDLDNRLRKNEQC